MARGKENKALRTEIQQRETLLQQYGIAPGDNRLFLNNMQVPIDEPNLFEVLDLLKDDAAVMDQLGAMKYPPFLSQASWPLGRTSFLKL